MRQRSIFTRPNAALLSTTIRLTSVFGMGTGEPYLHDRRKSFVKIISVNYHQIINLFNSLTEKPSTA